MEFDPLTNTFINEDGRIGFVDPTYWMNNMYVEQQHAAMNTQLRKSVKADKQMEVKIRKKWMRIAQGASTSTTNPSAPAQPGMAVGSGRFKIPTMVLNRSSRTSREPSRSLLGMSSRSRKK